MNNKITATTRQELASKLAQVGAIQKNSVDYCAHCMSYASTTHFGTATITQTENGWSAVINLNF